ncbi:MAG: transglycosylase SLT domain-containing protein [Gammaproteobacteria bacterium]|nr:transglycosylase SLT domain-containing protein [Gammaproteobacteria bacterium]MDH3971194.1 transglycosylase SLT domain-containing protein [Gammaproteobacteria bacterium]MDH3985040.1 transglycosylase SLT domain-containing protein [Gammaproteobacteria bacterium]
MRQTIRLFICCTCLLATVAGAASFSSSDPYRKQRALFMKADKALEKNRLDDYRQLQQQLTDYPLYPYLQYRELRRRLSLAKHEEIAGFIAHNMDNPLGRRMRQAWLYTLVKQRDWTQFLKTWGGNQPVKLQCYKLQAQIKTGQTEGLVEHGLKLWLVGKSQEKACDPVFEYLEVHHRITRDLIMQRIRLAMYSGNPGLAGWLAKRLPEKDAAWVDLWREARVQPAKTLKSTALNKDTPASREIILYSIRRIARSDADQAYKKWAQLKPRYRFSDEEIGQLEKKMAMSANWQKNPRAHEWLAAVPDAAADSSVREWRVRTAIANKDWESVYTHATALLDDTDNKNEWQYWQAVALKKTAQPVPAENIFSLLASQRDYHGFLAADILKQPYQMGNKPLQRDTAALDSLERQPGIVRAHELFRAGKFLDARREWANATRNFSKEELKLAAILADQWGWHDRAILTVASAKDYSDLKLRFPVDYENNINSAALDRQLHPTHVYAVIRQESAFNKDALSPAGAMGLMQLMPKTGRATAKKYNIPLGNTRLLYQSDKNIAIGSAYLQQVMEQYDNNVILASAAYNAGPHRVDRWLPDNEAQPADSWIARIPYRETRKYVQRILAYIAIYDWRLDQPVTPLHKHMPVVLPSGSYSGTK